MERNQQAIARHRSLATSGLSTPAAEAHRYARPTVRFMRGLLLGVLLSLPVWILLAILVSLALSWRP